MTDAPADVAEYGVPRGRIGRVPSRMRCDEAVVRRLRIVAEEQNDAAGRGADAPVACCRGSGRRLGENLQRDRKGGRACAETVDRVVARSVVDDDDFEATGRFRLLSQAVERVPESGTPVARRDDDGERDRARVVGSYGAVDVSSLSRTSAIRRSRSARRCARILFWSASFEITVE